ncbi:hypothetical protein C8A01DRAFT_20400 [Parachaetomium inaequale]|uniref:Uncharacterized protein n=1 Tax=Parachaetomium inaequale TaxID=2588326 RepID=A0AAN6SMA4_9PEZI|nr:hypothetical protein C8A01DRAFT_20400 [Parachaetomium inaequale]
MVKVFISALLGLASLQGVLAAPKAYPEVIPGPGLPSLAELDVTSAQLYEMGVPKELSERDQALDKRYTGKCGPAEGAYTNVNDIIGCYNYLRLLGTQSCAAGRNTVMCTVGQANVYGSALNGQTSSACRDVAAGVLWTINSCTRADQSCAGSQAANGNGNLIVSSVNVTW